MVTPFIEKMAGRKAGEVFCNALRLNVTARHALISFVVWTCLAACAGPAPPSIPEESTAFDPAQPQPVPTRIHSDLPTIVYTIQVGAFSNPERAAAFALTLKKYGIDAYYFVDADGLCKVRFERFETKASAHHRALELQSLDRIDDFYVVQPGSDNPLIDPEDALRSNIVRTARRFIGTPYRWGGESVGDGFDCSGLTMTVYRLNGLELPRNSRSQFRAGTPIHKEGLRMGDLVFFSTRRRHRVSHVGVYTGDGHFIHSPGRGKRIRTSSLDNRYFRQRYMGARRYF